MNKILIVKLIADKPELVFNSLNDSEIMELSASLPFGFWGHYDWLRKDASSIVGVRWVANEHEFPFDHKVFFNTVKRLNYVSVDGVGIVTVFFSSERYFVEAISQDQEIDSSAILMPSGDVRYFSLVFSNPPKGVY